MDWRLRLLSIAWLGAVLTSPAGVQAQDQAPVQVSVQVDLRVELLTIVFRLAGASEFNRDEARSPYAEAVDKHFGSFREHPAVLAAQRLREQHGVSHDAVPSFALHLTDVETLAERVPFDARPARLVDRWPLEPAREFLSLLRDFARETHFAEFAASQAEIYALASQRLSELVRNRLQIVWLNEYFGDRGDASFRLSVGLLCGPNAFGTGVRFADGQPEEIHPVIGVWQRDSAGRPVFDATVLPIVVHELCHSYANPLVTKHLPALQAAGEVLLPPVAASMRRQAYPTWQIVLNESLVRAVVVRYLATHHGAAAAQEQAADATGRSFAWVPDLARELERYERDRQTWPTLGHFMPEVAVFFAERARVAAEAAAKLPQVLSMQPGNGALDVDPALPMIEVRFDRAMDTRGHSVVGGGDDFPELTGKPQYDESGRVFTLPVRLLPGKTYRFGLNGGRFQNFRAADGAALAPVLVEFTTRGA
ncbi:MAG: DUF4932 domain-containing protein [Planctomycetota bacterium]